MSPLQIIFLTLVFVASFGLVIWLLARTTTTPVGRRLQRVLGGGGDLVPTGRDNSVWVERAVRAARPLARLSLPEPGFETSALRRRFMNAGIRHAAAPMTFFGVKTALALGLPASVFAGLTLSHSTTSGVNLLFMLLLATSVGYYLPNVLLARAVRLRQREIFEEFPDALDLMTVCMEAGLGVEAALTKVAEEIGHKSPALSEELRLLNLELRAGASRELALRNLAMRTGVEEVEGFVTMIVQAVRFGTSIAQSLRVHSETVRGLRRQRAEEMAAKVPLKLLFPLIFCIFPALMLVIMGPAVIQMVRIVMPTMGGGN